MMDTPTLAPYDPDAKPELLTVHRRSYRWEGDTETHWTGERVYVLREIL